MARSASSGALAASLRDRLDLSPRKPDSPGVGPNGSALAAADDPDALVPAMKYTFSDGFMREMFLSRMLDNQKTALEAKVSEARLDLFKKRVERACRLLLGPSRGSGAQTLVPILSSVLYVRDQPPPQASVTPLSARDAEHEAAMNGAADGAGGPGGGQDTPGEDRS